jgi:hypothetical protein
MYTTVVEHEGKLVYGALSEDGKLLAIFSTDVIELCDRCLQRQCCCFIKTATEAINRLCRICLNKETGAI